ncbi:RloB family protein [Shewanella sp.]|uniref:RloB family protein n=1 Tax=Shewanella sp. TaxID=50422 RepID=UPI0040545B1F
MGSDDLHRRRKAKSKHDLSRREAKREQYKKILIVCEGEKTELYYFQDLINHYKLNTANIQVVDNKETCPLKLFEFAQDFEKKERKSHSPFDTIYCVFDRDTHTNYGKAIEKIKLLPKYEAVTSIPCFEYWLLLHFKQSSKPYNKKGKKSVGDQVLSDLLQVYNSYRKGNKQVFSDLYPKLANAIKHAEVNRNLAKKSGTDNPSTEVDLMVVALQNIKKTN